MSSLGMLPGNTTATRWTGLGGLGRPHLAALYTPWEIENRELPVAYLEIAVLGRDGTTESTMPLFHFLSKDAIERVCRENLSWTGGDADGAFLWDLRTDEQLARLLGLTARDVYEARLSRALFEASVSMLADHIADFCDGGDWADTDLYLAEVFPTNAASVWSVDELVAESCDAVSDLAERINQGDRDPARCVGDELLLQFAINRYYGYLRDAGMVEPHMELELVLLTDQLAEVAEYVDEDESGFVYSAEAFTSRWSDPANWFTPYAEVDASDV